MAWIYMVGRLGMEPGDPSHSLQLREALVESLLTQCPAQNDAHKAGFEKSGLCP